MTAFVIGSGALKLSELSPLDPVKSKLIFLPSEHVFILNLR